MMNQRLERIISDAKEIENNKRRLLEELTREPPLSEQQITRKGDSQAIHGQFNEQLKDVNKSFEYLQNLMADSIRSIGEKLAQRKVTKVEQDTIKTLKDRVAVLERENSGLRLKLESKDRQLAQMGEQMGRKERSYEKRLQQSRQDFKETLQTLSLKLESLKNGHCALRNFVLTELKASGLNEVITSIIQRNQHTLKTTQALQAAQFLPLKKAQQEFTAFKEKVVNCCASVASYTSVKQPSSLRLLQEFPLFSQELIKELSISRLLCQSDLIIDQTTRLWLLEQLREEMNCDRMASRVIYRFGKDEPNKVNFHHYIDGRPNVMVIVKLANGNTVGVFSKFPISEHHIEKPGCGFLFNATKREAYLSFSESTQGVAGYDPYYIIFGNSEFRLKSQELRFYSNFGISSGSFKARGHKRIDFMGVEDTETDFEMFQVHQILS